jgi:hypothetical protein
MLAINTSRISRNKLFLKQKNVFGFFCVLFLLNVFAIPVWANTSANTSVTVIPFVETLATAKTTAHAALAAAYAAYISTNYIPTNWTVLNGFKAAGDTAIDAATTLDGVASAQTAAMTGMSGVRTIAQALDWFNNVVKRTDIVRDGAIDVLDFNALMVQWGKIGAGNPADANQDGSVDIFDFNLLMVYWDETEPL